MSNYATRLFVKSVTNANASAISLRDSAGTLMGCTYVKVCLDASATGSVLIEPTVSGLGTNVAVAIGNGTSGTLGGVATTNQALEIFTSGPEKIVSIKLTMLSGVGTAYVIYGIRRIINPLKGNVDFIGM